MLKSDGTMYYVNGQSMGDPSVSITEIRYTSLTVSCGRWIRVEKPNFALCISYHLK